MTTCFETWNINGGTSMKVYGCLPLNRTYWPNIFCISFRKIAELCAGKFAATSVMGIYMRTSDSGLSYVMTYILLTSNIL